MATTQAEVRITPRLAPCGRGREAPPAMAHRTERPSCRCAGGPDRGGPCPGLEVLLAVEALAGAERADGRRDLVCAAGTSEPQPGDKRGLIGGIFHHHAEVFRHR